MRRPTDLRYDDGRTPSYEAIRRYVLKRDPLCTCGQPSAEVDHIWPRCYGGTDVASNLQGLCATCNKRKGNGVDLNTAGNSKLHAAAEAISNRIFDLLEDMRRFDEELLVRGCGNGSEIGIATAMEFLGYRERSFDDLRSLVSGRAAVLSETIAWLTDQRMRVNS